MASKQVPLTKFIKRVSEEEKYLALEKIASKLAEDEEYVCQHAAPIKPKNPVGRPRRPRCPQATLFSAAPRDPPPLQPQRKIQKRRGQYTNWFRTETWPLIEAAMKQHRHIGDALHYLQVTHRKPGSSEGLFDKLSRGSLYEWFTSDGKLKPKFLEHVERRSQFTPTAQNQGPLSSRPDVIKGICDLLLKMRDAGQSLGTGIVQPIIVGYISARAPELLGKFKVTLEWTRHFMKTQLNWSYRRATTACGKLPQDWEDLGKCMAYRLAYLIKAYDIPPALIVNTDQTGINLVPMARERTWERKGMKDVKVIRMEDKRQVTVCVSSAADGYLLPFQIIFTGKTNRCLPKTASATKCLDSGFHFTMTENHWSNLKTCKEFVQKILIPYYMRVSHTMGLPANQKFVWLIDCWSVHKSEAFLSWMKKEFPSVCVLFVPANCTSKFQPADVVIQRPLKCAFSKCFKQWTATCIQEQLKCQAQEANLNGPSEVKLDLRIGTLRDCICEWLLEAWKSVGCHLEMIKRGWAKCGLLRSFDRAFQAEAMEANSKSSLFVGGDNICKELEELEELDEDWDDLFDDVDVLEMMVKLTM